MFTEVHPGYPIPDTLLVLDYMVVWASLRTLREKINTVMALWRRCSRVLKNSYITCPVVGQTF